MSAPINKNFLPRPEYLPELRTPTGEVIPFPVLMSIDTDNIDSEFVTHAAWLATIGYAHARAEAESSAMKKAVERKRAQLFFHYTEVLKEQKIKTTLDTINYSIDLDADFQHLENLAAQAAEKSAVLKTAYWAFSDRKDALIALSASMRLETPKLMRREE